MADESAFTKERFMELVANCQKESKTTNDLFICLEYACRSEMAFPRVCFDLIAEYRKLYESITSSEPASEEEIKTYCKYCREQLVKGNPDVLLEEQCHASCKEAMDSFTVAIFDRLNQLFQTRLGVDNPMYRDLVPALTDEDPTFKKMEELAPENYYNIIYDAWAGTQKVPISLFKNIWFYFDARQYTLTNALPTNTETIHKSNFDFMVWVDSIDAGDVIHEQFIIWIYHFKQAFIEHLIDLYAQQLDISFTQEYEHNNMDIPATIDMLKPYIFVDFTVRYEWAQKWANEKVGTTVNINTLLSMAVQLGLTIDMIANIFINSDSNKYVSRRQMVYILDTLNESSLFDAHIATVVGKVNKKLEEREPTGSALYYRLRDFGGEQALNRWTQISNNALQELVTIQIKGLRRYVYEHTVEYIKNQLMSHAYDYLSTQQHWSDEKIIKELFETKLEDLFGGSHKVRVNYHAMALTEANTYINNLNQEDEFIKLVTEEQFEAVDFIEYEDEFPIANFNTLNPEWYVLIARID